MWCCGRAPSFKEREQEKKVGGGGARRRSVVATGTGQAPAKLLGPMVSCARIGYFSNHGALKVFGRPPHPR